jgi:type II secretory ATPase GspE/PulE/Tfp pilus assembly ATPase PilB-like protein
VGATWRRLGQILVEGGTISAESLDAALERCRKTGERTGEALIAMSACNRHDVLAALALQQGLTFMFGEEMPSALPVLRNLSPKYLRQYTVCPVALEGSTLTVATADPTNPLVADDLRQTLGLNIKLAVAPADAILEAIERTYGAGASTALQKIVDGIAPTEGDGESSEDVTVLRDMAFEAPVVRLVNLLIEEAVRSEASDIHIEPFEDTLRVRYRIDGILYTRSRRRGGSRPRSPRASRSWPR